MISKPKVAIFSDLHLGIYGNSYEWHKIALFWANWISKELKKKKIKDIFFLGDFFHNRSEISVQTIHVAAEVLSHFSDFNIIMIVGNHDAYYKNRSDVHSLAFLKGFSNITIVDETLKGTAYGKTLEFIPWNSEIDEEPADYLFGHFEIQSFKMNNFKVCDHGLSPSKLIDKSDNIFSGHFHNRNEKKYSNGSIRYVGNTFPMDFADVDNQKGYYILDVETNELEFFPNTVSPKYKKILVSKIKEVKEEDIKTNIVKLVIDVELTEAKVEKVKAYLGKFRPYQLTVEYAFSTRSNEVSEDIETFDMGQMFDEFIGQLKMEEDKETRVKAIITELHEKNSI